MAITIVIDGDPKGFEDAAKQVSKAFGQMTDDTEKFSKEGSGALDVFKGTLAALGVEQVLGLIKDGFTSAVAAIQEFSAAGRESETAINAFNQSLANTGKFSATTSEEMKKFAEQLQKTTNIEDEAVLKSAALIQQLGNLDKEGLQRATSAAADLSAALGIDLQSASNLLGKAAQGNVEMLKKYGIQVEDTGNKSKDFAAALSQIEGRFGGTAAALTNTLQGALDRASISFGDIKENVGTAINSTPELIGAFKGVGDVFELVSELVNNNKDAIQDLVRGGVDLFIDSISVAGGAANIFLDSLSIGNIVVTEIQNTFLKLTYTLADFAGGLTSVGSAVAGFFGVSTEALDAITQEMELFKSATQEVKEENDAEAEAFVAANESRKASISDFTNTAVTAIQARVDAQVAAGTTENQALLEQQNERAIINQQATDAEIAYKTLANDQYFQYLTDNLGKQETLELQFQLKKLTNEGKYQEALRLAQKTQIAARKNDILAYENFEDLTNKQRLENMKGTFSTIASLQATSTGTLFEVGKAAAIATATIDGIAAVQKALSSAPPPFNFALAAVVGIATAANIGKIASQSPPKTTGAAQGGYVANGVSGSMDTEPYMLAKGELIAPAQSFDEVVEGTARQRGFTKQGEENSNQKGEGLTIFLTVQGDFVGDQLWVNRLGEQIREAVLNRGMDLGVGA